MDLHRLCLRLFPEQVVTGAFEDGLRALVKKYTDIELRTQLDSTEAVPRGQLKALIPGTSFLAVIGLGPRQEKLLLELDLRFVNLAVARLLADERDTMLAHRPLTEVEAGVFSFLLLKILNLLRPSAEEAHPVAVRLEDTRNDLRSCADILAQEEHWLVATWSINTGFELGYIRALLPDSLPLRVGARPAGASHKDMVRPRNAKLRERLPRLRRLRFEGRVELGRLELSSRELSTLERGDVVVWETSEITLDRCGQPEGAAMLRLGKGLCGAVLGTLYSGEPGRLFRADRVDYADIPPTQLIPSKDGRSDMAEQTRHHSESLSREPSCPEAHAPSRSGPGGGVDAGGRATGSATDSRPTGDSVGSARRASSSPEVCPIDEDDITLEMEPFLRDLPVTVVIEMGRVQLTAEEVLGLRAGQVLELGRSPTPTVDVVTNGHRLAAGELVEIEGRLGVRITIIATESGA